VLCSFGVMFFPDKVRANREARRVLRSGGRYVLVSFDRLELNPVPKAAGDAVDALFPDDPTQYMERGPFSYSDPTLLEHDLAAADFTDVELETVELTSRVSARDAAQGIVLGSPFRAPRPHRPRASRGCSHRGASAVGRPGRPDVGARCDRDQVRPDARCTGLPGPARLARGPSPKATTEDGAFMEPSGRNRWQPIANGIAGRTARIGENRCDGLRPVAVGSAW
jgi:hypothetical protein